MPGGRDSVWNDVRERMAAVNCGWIVPSNEEQDAVAGGGDDATVDDGDGDIWWFALALVMERAAGWLETPAAADIENVVDVEVDGGVT